MNRDNNDDILAESPLGQSGCRKVIELEVDGLSPEAQQLRNNGNEVIEEDFDADFDMLF